MIKKIIYKIFGKNIGSQVRRILYFYKSGKKKINSTVEYKTYSYGFHTSCGYYDLDPIKDGALLVITTDDSMDRAKIHQIDINSGADEVLGESTVVNWQQGNRVKWLADKTIIFNSFEDNHYISVEIRDGISKRYRWPVYDVKGDFAVTLDFNRLGWMRPGYGYTKFPLNDVSIDDCAIRLFKLSTEEIIANITYRDLINKFPREVNLQNCYINHLSFSPSGGKFLFFFIEIKNGIHQCSLAVYDGKDIIFLESELSASHYSWKTDNDILTTSYDDQRRCGYYLYSLNKKNCKQVLPDLLNQDGHPTYIDENTIVTDTYPDSAGFQHIKVVDLLEGSCNEIVSIYSTARHVGVERCDLHPRYAKETQEIFFDADIDGRRRVYSFKLEDLTR